MTPFQPVRLRDHIWHKSGEIKSVCVTACLTALGVPLNSYHYTGGAMDSRRESILRKNGYCVRSRMSALGKQKTVGNARKVIRKLADPAGTYYLVVVKVDRRKILSIKACFKS